MGRLKFVPILLFIFPLVVACSSNEEKKIDPLEQQLIDKLRETKFYALIMAVENYQDPNINRLFNPVNDAKTIAKEWGRFNIYANAVAYGWIETRLTADKAAGETIDIKGEQVALGIPIPQEGLDARKQVIPLGRAGTADEAAGPVFFLCSPLSDYVTGHVLMVTGGR